MSATTHRAGAVRVVVQGIRGYTHIRCPIRPGGGRPGHTRTAAPPYTGPPAKERGLTLLELLAVVAVAAILGAAALPRAGALLAAIRLPLGARQLATDSCIARATAVLRNTRARITFREDRYTVRYEAGEPAEILVPLPAGIRVVRLPNSRMLRFFPSGRADNGTVVLAAPSGQRRAVVVNQRGRVMVR